jgi:predicted nucleotidyltransferase
MTSTGQNKPLRAPHQFLRKLVLKTNPYWPFTEFNRLAYDAAVRTFVRKFRGSVEISGIYVRRDSAEDAWVPGLSDIDLAVILRPELSAAEEHKVLVRFWNGYLRLKRFFPIFEIKLLSEPEFPLWLALTAASHKPRSWALLHGQENRDLEADYSPRWRNRALDFALWVYLDLFPPCLAISDAYLRTEDLRRRAKKIFKLLKPILGDGGASAQQLSSDPAVLTASVLQALSLAALSVAGIVPHNTAETNIALETRENTVFVIVDDTLPNASLVPLIRSSYTDWPAARFAPTVLTRGLLTYLVRHHDPYTYEIFRTARLLHGADPLASIPPPDKPQIADYLRSRIDNVFAFACSAELFAEPLSWRTLKFQMDQAMAVHLLLRDDWVAPTWPEVNAKWRGLFPDCSRAFDDVEAQVRETRFSAAREAFFYLFRPVSNSIRDALISSKDRR